MSELFDSLKLPHHTSTTNGRGTRKARAVLGDDGRRASVLEANVHLNAETEAAGSTARRLQPTSPPTSAVRLPKGVSHMMSERPLSQTTPRRHDAAAAMDDGSVSASPSSSGSRQPDGSAHGRRSESHVYWHVPASPSLRAREAEHRRNMARAMGQERPPMASQAFQEQLLKQSVAATAAAAEKGDLDGQADGTTTESESASASTGKTRSMSSSALRRRLSRRQSRKSFASLGGLAATSSSGRRLDGAIGSVMSELDNHLLFNSVEQDLDDEHGDGKSKASQSSSGSKAVMERVKSAVEHEQDNVQQALIEHMDRAFSQEDSMQPSTPQQRLRRVAIWTRTTSMPARMYEEPSEAEWDEAMKEFEDVDLAKVPATVVTAHSMLGKRTFPHSPGVAAQTDVLRQNHRRTNSMSGELASDIAEGQVKERVSPHKRRAGSPMKMSPTKSTISHVGLATRKSDFVRTTSEGSQQLSGKQQQQGRQRQMPNRRTTATMQQGRGPRVGLSRSNVSSSQAATRLFGGEPMVPCDGDGRAENAFTKHTSGPAAPFRLPLRRSPRKKGAVLMEAEATERGPVDSTQKSRAIEAEEHIFLNDEDDTKRRPAKSSEEIYILEDGEDIPSSLIDFAQDMDASFEETSLDEDALCQALDEVEASQSAHVQGSNLKSSSANSKGQQKPVRKQKAHADVILDSQSSPPPYSEDGFDISIDEDVSAAILSQMDAKGW